MSSFCGSGSLYGLTVKTGYCSGMEQCARKLIEGDGVLLLQKDKGFSHWSEIKISQYINVRQMSHDTFFDET